MKEGEGDFETLLKEATEETVEEAAQWIRKGELVAFPTETVYGLGANGLDGSACKKIFEAKGRPQDNPLILHIADRSQLDEIVEEVPASLEPLMEKLWPGPMTLIFKKSQRVPREVTAGGETVGVRMPSHPIARVLIRKAACPIAAPSANRSGKPSPTNARDVLQDMAGRIPFILNGGDCQIGIESTVIDATVEPAEILRPGYYTREVLDPFLRQVRYDRSILRDGEIPKSPGQKYRHYAPDARVTIYLGSPEGVFRTMQVETQKNLEQGKRTGLLLFEEEGMRIEKFGDQDYLYNAGGEVIPAHRVCFCGKRGNLERMASLMFTALRQFDREGMDEIIAEGVEAEGFGVSIMNRLRKSASGRVFYVD